MSMSSDPSTAKRKKERKQDKEETGNTPLQRGKWSPWALLVQDKAWSQDSNADDGTPEAMLSHHCEY
jgi:hypothetical protein